MRLSVLIGLSGFLIFLATVQMLIRIDALLEEAILHN